eukprot:12391-Rhodomonas_salina.2
MPSLQFVPGKRLPAFDSAQRARMRDAMSGTNRADGLHFSMSGTELDHSVLLCAVLRQAMPRAVRAQPMTQTLSYAFPMRCPVLRSSLLTLLQASVLCNVRHSHSLQHYRRLATRALQRRDDSVSAGSARVQPQVPLPAYALATRCPVWY